MNKGNKIFLIFTLFYLYITIAIFESSKGNFIPFFIEEFKISNSVMSLILSVNTLGAIIGSFLAGQFCETKGHKFVYVSGTLISLAAVLIAPFTKNVFMLIFFNFLFGLGRSCIAIGVDSMVPFLSAGFESILMNITHFMYGMGSFAGQGAIGTLLTKGFTWRSIYAFMILFFIAAFILSLFIKTPSLHFKSEKAYKSREFYKNPLIYMFTAALTFGLISEATINTWFISYMRITYGLNPSDAAKYASVFFLLFALGRLFGGFVLNKTGNLNGLTTFLALGAACIILGLNMKESGLVMIAASGLFISVMFPTMMVVISSAFKQNSSFAIGFIVTVSNVLNMFLFNITGVLNDISGTYAALYTAPVSLICCAAMLIIIRKTEKTIYMES